MAVVPAKRGSSDAFKGSATMSKDYKEITGRISANLAKLRADIPEKHRLMETLKTQGLAAFLKARDA